MEQILLTGTHFEQLFSVCPYSKLRFEIELDDFERVL